VLSMMELVAFDNGALTMALHRHPRVRTRARALRACALTLACAAAACSGSDPREPYAPDVDAQDAVSPGGGGGADPDFLTELESPEQYAELAAEGAEVKYLLALEDAEVAPPLDAPCVFQNTRRFALHVEFLHEFPEYSALDYDSYLALVLRRATRAWWGGGLKLWADAVHPRNGRVGVVSFTVYQDGGGDENLTAEEIASVYARLAGCAPYAAELLVFVPDGAAQLAHARAIRGELDAEGVPVLEPNALRPGLGAEVYSEGETYGYLRIVPEGELLEEYGSEDIAIAESAPNDLSLLSGLVTVHPQSLHSHVNLRLREKGIPNASVPDVYENQLVRSLEGRLVHLRAAADRVEVAPARLAEAQAFWERTRTRLSPLAADLEIAEVAPFAALVGRDATAYGTKAANLGELHALLPEEHRADGFALPFSAYARFMAESGLDVLVQELLDDPEVHENAAVRRARLSALRAAILAGTTDPGLLAEVHAQALAVFGADAPNVRLRFRSSTNAEDLDALSGAGLYESKSGCLADDMDADAAGHSHCLTAVDAAYYQARLDAARAELAAHPDRVWLETRIADDAGELNEEKSAAAAIRKVWASLWSLRAFEERAYWGMDHRAVHMGLAVNAAFTRERLDAVAVTALDGGGGLPVYRVVTQVAEVGVVQPDDPSAAPETLLFRRGAGDEVLEPEVLIASSFSEDGGSLWSDAQLETLGAVLYAIQDHFAREVYPDVDRLSLDVEIKLTHDDRIVVKQARPYAAARP
jgi:pyruvate,water dikinase